MTVVSTGALCFGLVIGWVTYRTLRRKEGNAALSDLATVIGVVGGGVVTTLFADQTLFGWYSIGLAVGFFGYFISGLFLGDKSPAWMMES